MGKDNEIACDKHGKSTLSYVCCHLFDSGLEKGTGFFESFRELGDEHQAWCKQCDDLLVKEGDWTDALTAQADIKLVCLQCYKERLSFQLTHSPELVDINYEAENSTTDEMYEIADQFIDLANKQENKYISEVCEAFTYACSRFTSYEAVNVAEDIEKNKKEIIEFYTERFKAMLVDNLNDYMANNQTEEGQGDE